MDEITTKFQIADHEQLLNGIRAVDKYVNRTYLSNLEECPVVLIQGSELRTNSIRLYMIDKIVFDEEEITNDKLISVYSAVQNVGAALLLLIRGTQDGTQFFIGINDSSNVSISEKTLHKSFKANFPGSKLSKKSNAQISELLDGATLKGESCNVSCVTVVPATRDDDKEKFVQGIEKFIDTMRGETYSAIFIARPIAKTELENKKRGLEDIYSALSPFAKSSVSYGENESKAVSKGISENFSQTINESISTTLGTNTSKNESRTKGSNFGFNLGFTTGTNNSTTVGSSYGTSRSKTDSSGKSDTYSSGTNTSDTITSGTSATVTIEAVNKSVDVLMNNIELQLERIKACESYGMWDAAVYFIAEEIQTSIVAANAFKALVAGEQSGTENSYINIWNQHNANTAQVAEYIRYCKHPVFETSVSGDMETQIVTPANQISGSELPILFGLPHKSVNGVSVTTMAEFGRNVFLRDGVKNASGRQLPLGSIYHMGVEDEGNTVSLDIDSFTSHCFVTGSTGSGKSNTVYGLLQSFYSNNIPFLVVEPAKGEYKAEFGGIPGINIFGTNPYMGAMLKINPFAFHPNIHILEHLDRLIEIFNACWEMYAAMPAILKSAVEKAYTDKGWDLLNSVYMHGGKPQYPTFEDVLSALPKIIKSTGYSADSQGDYTGALVTRVESLTNGISGQIFCDNYVIPDTALFDENTIIDLSRIGSTETKSLIMGILVMQLTEYRMANANGSNKALSHVTVLEEAHNLLKNVSHAQGQQTANLVGKSVEMICNSIAEMRTYGEGFIIVDQSPTSVDIAAIKNTNTKIVMRLPEKEDCVAVGNAIGLKEKQILELAKLPVGVAAVMQSNWNEAVLSKVNLASNRYCAEAEASTFACLKQVRSIATRELLSQWGKGFASNGIVSKINEADAPEYVKAEICARVRQSIAEYNDTSNVGNLCNALVHLVGAAQVFKINEPLILGNEGNAATVFSWYNKMLDHLKQIVLLNSGKEYDFLLRRLLYAYTRRNDTKVQYGSVYHTLYMK